MKRIVLAVFFVFLGMKAYAQPTGIVLGAFSGTFCAGTNSSVGYTSTGGGTTAYSTNNAFYVELSNAAGTFPASNPVNIGTLLSTARTGTVDLSFPSSLPSGTGYRIRIVASMPTPTGLTSAASSPFTINASPSIAIAPTSSVCLGTNTLDVNYTAPTGSPDRYSISWNAAALSAGLTNVTNASLPASKITLSGLSGVGAGEYTGAVIVTNSTTGCSRDVTTETVCGVAAENSTATFATVSGLTFTSVKFASYGNGSGTCGNFVKGSCDAVNSIPIVRAACVGQSTCSIIANNATFTDPCVNSIKNLLVELQSATFSIIISPTTASITATKSTICSGEFTTLTATAGQSYSWNTGATTQSITVSPSTSTTYTCTVTNLGCNTSMASSTITVNPSPTAVVATSSPVVCSAATTYNLTLSSIQNSPTQYSIDWGDNVSAMTDIGFTNFSGNTISITGITGTAGTYPATIYLKNTTTQCVGNITGGTQCASVGEGASLSMTAPASNRFISIPFASFGTPLGACGSYTTGACHNANSVSTVRTAAYNNNTFSILAHSSVFTPDPCSSTIKTLAVQAVYSSFALTVSSTTATLTNPGPQSACVGATTAAVNIVGVNITGINWTNSNTGIGLAASGSDNAIPYVIPSFTATNVGLTSGVGTITITPYNATCTGAPISFTYTVNPIPSVSNQSTSVCSGTPFSVIPTGVPVGTVYDWSAPTGSNFTGGSGQTNQSSISQTLTNTGTAATTATYGTVTPKYNGCSGSNFTVTVNIDKVTTSVFTTSGSYLVPAGVTSLTVEVWGGGGGGGAAAGMNTSGGGGSGGAYARRIVTVVPGQSYPYTVGAGGAGGNGGAAGNGGSSWFGSTSTLLAVGGNGAAAAATTNTGAVGATAVTTGNVGGAVNFYGGAGGNGTNLGDSGGGGGSAGTSSNGNAGVLITGGSAVTGGSAGANGVALAWGTVGGAPGGGGSGGRSGLTPINGGNGGAGQVRITVNPSISYPSAAFCKSTSSALATKGGYTVGVFSSTTGLSINANTGEINPSLSTSGTYTITFTTACALPATASVTISETPTVTAGSNISSCTGTADIAVSGATAGGSYSASTWSYVATTGTGNVNSGGTTLAPIFRPVSAAGSGTLTLTLTGSVGCTGNNPTSQRTISWGTAPTASAGSNVSSCTGTADIATSGSTADGTYSATTWSYTASTGTGSIFSGSNTLTPTFRPSSSFGSGTLTLTVTGSGACSASIPTSARTISWGTTPTASAGSNVSSCTGTADIATSGATAGGTYSTTTWSYTASTGTGSIFSGSNTLTPAFRPSSSFGSGTLTLTVTGDYGCAGNNPTSQRTISWGTTPTASAGSNVSSCTGTADIATSGATASGTYGTTTWSYTATTGTGSIFSGSNTLTPTFRPSSSFGSGTLTLTVTGSGACSASTPTSARTISWGTTPTASAGSNVSSCTGTADIATGGSTAGGTYGTTTWSYTATTGTGSIFSGSNTLTPTFRPSSSFGSGTLTLTVTGDYGCTGSNPTSARTITWATTPTATAGTAIVTCLNAGAVNITAGASASNYAGITWTSPDGTGNFVSPSSLTLATYAPTGTDATAGTRTLTLTAIAHPGCSNAASSKTITINTAPSIVSQPGSLSKCFGETATFIVTASGSGPLSYQWKKAGIDIVGAVSSSLSIPSVSASSAGTYEVLVSGICPAPVTSNTVNLTLNADNTWTGAISRDWFTPGNWGCGSIPSRVLSAIIPSAVQYPIVSTISTATALNISIASSASLTLSNNATIAIYGNWSNAGELHTNNATVAFKGIINQIIENSSAVSTEKFYNLTIGKNGGTVALSPSTNVEILPNGTVKLDSGTLDLNNRSFLLRSTFPYNYDIHKVDSTARLGRVAGTLLRSSNFALERYIPTPPTSGYHFVKTRFLSNSLQGVTASQWADSVTILGGDATNGFVQDPSWGNVTSTLSAYNESSTVGGVNSRFKSIMTRTTPLNVGQGYAMSVGFDAQPDQTKYPAPRNYVILKVKGLPTVGNFSTPITKSGADPYGWNLVGNPYPCEIDWDTLWSLNASKVSSTMVILDPLGGFTSGQHYYYNARTKKSIDPRYTIDSANFATTTRLNRSLIASSQAFFVFNKVGGTSSFHYQENTKPLSSFRTAANLREEEVSWVNIGVTNGVLHDNTYVFFDEEAKYNAFDPDFDAYKITNSGLNISTNTFGSDLAMNGVPLSGTWSIPIKMTASARGQYKLVVQGEGLGRLAAPLFLKDKYKEKTMEVTAHGRIAYDFEVNTDPTSVGQRFLLFSPSIVTGLEENDLRNSVTLQPNPAVSDAVSATLSNPGSSHYSVEIVDANGIKVYERISVPLSLANTLLIDGLSDCLASAVYTVRIVSGSEVYHKKLVYKK